MPNQNGSNGIHVAEGTQSSNDADHMQNQPKKGVYKCNTKAFMTQHMRGFLK